MTHKKTIGQQLKEQRNKMLLTQSELYSKSGISTFTISGLESERIKDTSTYILRQLSAALDYYKFDI